MGNLRGSVSQAERVVKNFSDDGEEKQIDKSLPVMAKCFALVVIWPPFQLLEMARAR